MILLISPFISFDAKDVECVIFRTGKGYDLVPLYATTVYDESDNLFAIGDGHLHCLQPYLFYNQIEYCEV